MALEDQGAPADADACPGLWALADDDGLAWVTGLCSVVLAGGSAALYRYLR